MAQYVQKVGGQAVLLSSTGFNSLQAASDAGYSPVSAPSGGGGGAPVNTNVAAPVVNTNVSTVKTQADSLGNKSVANRNYVNATFKELHGRDATAAELANFTGKGVLDVYNAISAGSPVAKTDLNSIINAGQDENINNKDSQMNGAPEVSAAEKIKADMTATKDLVAPDITKPTAPSLETTYNELRTTYGLTDLETSLTDLKNQERVLVEETNARKDYAESKPVALGVISGKQSEVDRQANKQLESLRRQQTYISDQLNTKYSIIQNLMTFRQTDYQNAMTAYNNEFTQNMSLLSTVRSQQQFEITEADKQKDNARADYTIFINGIKETGNGLKDITADQKTMLNKLEAQAGLPVGTYEMLLPKIGDQKLTSLGTANNSSGGQSAYFMTIDKKTGKPTITSVVLPGAKATSSGGGGNTISKEDKEIEAFRNEAATMIQKLDKDEINWGGAYDSIKVKYPNASNELIDSTLGGGRENIPEGVGAPDYYFNGRVHNAQGYWGRAING